MPGGECTDPAGIMLCRAFSNIFELAASKCTGEDSRKKNKNWKQLNQIGHRSLEDPDQKLERERAARY